MKVRILLIAAIMMAVVFRFQARAQTETKALYLLSISPGPVTLYRVDPEAGSAGLSALPFEEIGKKDRWYGYQVDRVLVDYDRQRLVVASPPNTPHNFAVINMANPAAAHIVTIDYDGAKVVPAAIYLLDDPKEGPLLAMALDDILEPNIGWRPHSLTAVRLDDPKGESVSLPLAELGYVRVSGWIGGAQNGPINEMPEVRGDPLHLLLADPVGFATNVPRPGYAPSSGSSAETTFWLAALNDSIAVLKPFEPFDSKTIDVFDRARASWRRFDLPFRSGRVRAFGPWIAAISSRPRLPEIPRTVVHSSELSKMPSSPGKEKRLTEPLSHDDHRLGTVETLFDETNEYFAGDLLVLNGCTGQQFTIHTGQGDSEVVLVTGQAIYYRANDEFYSAATTDTKLGPPIKLAEGPEIVGVHWAFLGPTTPAPK